MKMLLILAAAIAMAAVAGCSNRAAKAQAMLLEAISYTDGGTTFAAHQKGLQLTLAQGITVGDKLGDPSEDERVMFICCQLCAQILKQYPETPAAVKAAELQSQQEQKLKRMEQARLQSTFRNPDDWMK